MGTCGYDGVLSAWKTGQLTTEQAVGQLLQLLRELESRVAELERRRTLPVTAARRVRRRPAGGDGG